MALILIMIVSIVTILRKCIYHYVTKILVLITLFSQNVTADAMTNPRIDPSITIEKLKQRNNFQGTMIVQLSQMIISNSTQRAQIKNINIMVKKLMQDLEELEQNLSGFEVVMLVMIGILIFAIIATCIFICVFLIHNNQPNNQSTVYSNRFTEPTTYRHADPPTYEIACETTEIDSGYVSDTSQSESEHSSIPIPEVIPEPQSAINSLSMVIENSLEQDYEESEISSDNHESLMSQYDNIGDEQFYYWTKRRWAMSLQLMEWIGAVTNDYRQTEHCCPKFDETNDSLTTRSKLPKEVWVIFDILTENSVLSTDNSMCHFTLACKDLFRLLTNSETLSSNINTNVEYRYLLLNNINVKAIITMNKMIRSTIDSSTHMEFNLVHAQMINLANLIEDYFMYNNVPHRTLCYTQRSYY